MAEVFTFENGKQICFDRTIYANGKYVFFQDYQLLYEECRAVRDQLERANLQIDGLKERIKKLEKTRCEWADKDVEWKEKREEAEKKIKELESELEVKENMLKTKNDLCKVSENEKINLNERIKVKLTPLGAEIYYKQYDELNKNAGKTVLEPRMPKIDKDGYTEFLLWNFIELYGEHIGMCKPNVIDPIEIVLCD